MPPPGSTRGEQKGSHFVWLKSLINDDYIDFDSINTVAYTSNVGFQIIDLDGPGGFHLSYMSVAPGSAVAEVDKLCPDTEWFTVPANGGTTDRRVRRNSIRTVTWNGSTGPIEAQGVFIGSSIQYPGPSNTQADVDQLVQDILIG